jgi:hypothetical protein
MERSATGDLSRPYPHTRTKHRQVEVTVRTVSAYIDEQLAPLIEGLWRLGIATRFSCQSSSRQLNLMRRPRELFYVMFADTEDLRRMLELFVNTPLDPRHRRSLWRYELFPKFHDEPDSDNTSVGLHPVVFIPVEQIVDVVRVVQRAASDVSPAAW